MLFLLRILRRLEFQHILGRRQALIRSKQAKNLTVHGNVKSLAPRANLVVDNYLSGGGVSDYHPPMRMTADALDLAAARLEEIRAEEERLRSSPRVWLHSATRRQVKAFCSAPSISSL
jgi:hypothetical protein